MFGFSTENEVKATDVIAAIVFGALGFLGGTVFDFLAIKQEYEQFEHDQHIDHANRMLKEAEIAVELTEDLLGTDPQRKQIAIELIKVAVPTLGGQLLPLVVDTQDNTENTERATNALSGQRNALANGLYDPQKSNRENAFFSIENGWNSDAEMVLALLNTIPRYDGKDLWPILNGERNEWLFETGVLNTFNVLGRFPSEVLMAHKSELCTVGDGQKENGTQTRTAIEYVETLMDGC